MAEGKTEGPHTRINEKEYGELNDKCLEEMYLVTVLCSVFPSSTLYHMKTDNSAASVFISICAGRRSGMVISMKKKLVIISIILLLILEPWIVSLIHCEILTAIYGSDEVLAACMENSMIGEIETLKVLEKEPYYLKVYVKDENGGNIMILEEQLNASQPWREIYWWTVWSYYGSADGIIWPYIR